MNLTDTLWYLGRGTGTVALVMFTVTMVLGITTRSGRRRAPSASDRASDPPLRSRPAVTDACHGWWAPLEAS